VHKTEKGMGKKKKSMAAVLVKITWGLGFTRQELGKGVSWWDEGFKGREKVLRGMGRYEGNLQTSLRFGVKKNRNDFL